MEENEKVKKKTVLLTGGARGLGKELSLFLLEKGYSVIILDKVLDADLPADFKKKLLAYFQIDLTDMNAVGEFVRHDLFKDGLVIDIFIINAFPRVFKDFKDFGNTEISDFVNAAFLSQLLIANVLIKKMLKNDFGRIVIINSKSNVQGYSTGSLYCSLKSAWMTFHESLAKELLASNKNVSITSICPDSFTSINGVKLRHYDFIIRAIKKRILAALLKKKSAVYYTVNFKTRMILTYQLFKKLLNKR